MCACSTYLPARAIAIDPAHPLRGPSPDSDSKIGGAMMAETADLAADLAAVYQRVQARLAALRPGRRQR